MIGILITLNMLTIILLAIKNKETEDIKTLNKILIKSNANIRLELRKADKELNDADKLIDSLMADIENLRKKNKEKEGCKCTQ